MGLTPKPAWSGEYLPHGAVGMTVAPVVALKSGRIVRARRVCGMGEIPIVDAWASPSECTSYSSWLSTPGCWGHSIPYWQMMAGAVAPAPAPAIVPGTVSTLPAGTQDAAQQTVDTLLNQQMAAQQALNAANVDSSSFDLAAGNLYAAGETVTSGLAAIPWWFWLGGGVLAAALLGGIAFGGRR